MTFNKKIFIDSLVGLLLGGALMYAGYAAISKETLLKFFPDSQFESIVFYTSVIIAPIFAIVFHELGHLFAGLFQGFKLELFVVGFFGMKREDNKVKVYFNTNIQYFGGVAATSPKSILPDSELIDKYKIILISGPIASVLISIISFILFAIFDNAFNPFWGLLGITSFGIFLATTLPNKTGIFFTDRKRFQRLNDKGESGKIELVFLQTANQLLTGNTYSSLTLDNLNIIKSDRDEVMQFWGHYFEYQYYKEIDNQMELANSKDKLFQFKKLIPEGIWNTLEIE